MDVLWITTGALSVTTGIVGGLVLRQYIARLDEQRLRRRERP